MFDDYFSMALKSGMSVGMTVTMFFGNETSGGGDGKGGGATGG
jgi:hypothetical protein